jgi:glucose/arabinose dehydrogenase
MRKGLILVMSTLCLLHLGCTEIAPLPTNAGIGPNPQLPEPKNSIIPTVNIAPAMGWPAQASPVGPKGTVVTEFASDLDHPRWLYVLPNGDVLVAETNAPPKPDDVGGYSYFGKNVDQRVQPEQPAMVASAISPDYALGAHTASLGLASARGNTLPAEFANGMFIGQHGSWNRKPHSGYKVIFLPFVDGKPSGLPKEVLTCFLSADGQAYGRRVGVALGKNGNLLVADDVGNKVWSVSSIKQ